MLLIIIIDYYLNLNRFAANYNLHLRMAGKLLIIIDDVLNVLIGSLNYFG